MPGVGDALTLIPAGYLLVKGYRLGARKRTMARMAVNVGLDATLGAVPVIGDLFDLVYKANRRNFRLLRRELERQAPARHPRLSATGGALAGRRAARFCRHGRRCPPGRGKASLDPPRPGWHTRANPNDSELPCRTTCPWPCTRR